MRSPLIINSAEFVKSAVHPHQYPPDNLAEVAFAGRSNVGKSSLINTLVQRKKLVRTSNTPGRTQTLNFFLINGVYHFVDLPGYGYAKVPEAIRASWRPMVEAYLEKRKSLRGIVEIIDSRHPPTADDIKLWHWLRERNIPAIAVLTKADKINRGKWGSQLREASLVLGVPSEQLVLFSSLTQQGRDILWEKLLPWLELDHD